MPLPVRKTPRAQWHKYDGAEYFVTICTDNRTHYFGTVCDAQTQLTAVGECLKREIEHTKTIRKDDVSIPIYTIMPNHVHLIVVIHPRRDASNASATNASNASATDATNAENALLTRTQNNTLQNKNTDTRNIADTRGVSLQRFGPQSNNLGSVIRGIKSAVTHFAQQNGIPFAWQSRYHDHIIRNHAEMNRIAEYIEQNPLKWEMDCFNGNNGKNAKQ